MSKGLHLDGSLSESFVWLRGRQHSSFADPRLGLSGPGFSLCYRPQAVGHLDVAERPSMKRKKPPSLKSEAILVIQVNYLSSQFLLFRMSEKHKWHALARRALAEKLSPMDETVVGGALIACCTAPCELQYKQDYGHNQDDMNESGSHMKCKKSKQPHDDQHCRDYA